MTAAGACRLRRGGALGFRADADGYWIDLGHRDPHGVGDCQSPFPTARKRRAANAEIARQPTELLPTPSSRAEATE